MKYFLPFEVQRLNAWRRAFEGCMSELGMLEEIPEVFWPKLGALTALRGFRVCMATELYLATQKAFLLKEELHGEEIQAREKR